MSINPQPKPVREIDSDYTTFVKRQGCCCLPEYLFPHLCRTAEPLPIHPHHVSPRNGTKSAASKVSDLRQVPVCFSGHRYCETHPLEVLPFLNRVIRKLNREYDALHPKPKRERKASMKVGLYVKNCPCGREHFFPLHKVQFGKNIVGFLCKTKNQWIEADVA